MAQTKGRTAWEGGPGGGVAGAAVVPGYGVVVGGPSVFGDGGADAVGEADVVGAAADVYVWEGGGVADV
jgi:hypothetical protein